MPFSLSQRWEEENCRKFYSIQHFETSKNIYVQMMKKRTKKPANKIERARVSEKEGETEKREWVRESKGGLKRESNSKKETETE